MSRGTNILTMEYEDEVRTGSSTSSSTTRARAREIMDYASMMGLKPTKPMEDWVERLLAIGSIEAEVLMEVINETMMAPQPSWRYFAAIVRRLLNECPLTRYTIDRWEERKERWEQRIF